MRAFYVLLALLVGVPGCSDDNADPETIRETGYVRCQPDEAECGGLRCLEPNGESACVPLPGACDGVATCDCVGGAVCGDSACRHAGGNLFCGAEPDAAGRDDAAVVPDAAVIEDAGVGPDAAADPDAAVDPDAVVADAAPADAAVVPPPECEADFVVENPLPQGTHLYDVWGSARDDLYAVGLHVVLHFDGAEWRPLPLGCDSIQLTGVTGFAADDVYLAGAGFLLHYDGERFETLRTSVPIPAEALWADSPSDLFTVGMGGAVAHYDATTGRGQRLETGVDAWLHDVFGFAADDVWAVGDEGVALHFDGARWAETDTGTAADLEAIWGAAPDDVYAAGGDALLHWDGLEWAPAAGIDPATLVERGVRSLHGFGPDEIYAAGWEGTLRYFDGETWEELPTPVRTSLTDIWGLSADTLVAVGSGGQMLARQGDWVRTQTGEPVGNAVFAVDADVAWAVGRGGRIAHRERGAWASVASPVETHLTAVSGSWAVGAAGTILRLDAGAWVADASPTDADLAALWTDGDDALAVGAGGVVLRRGDGWQFEDAGTDRDLRSVWQVAPGVVYAVGAGGTVLRHDGAWSPVDAGVEADLNAVWGSGRDDVYLAGAGGLLVHFDGEAWTPIDSGMNRDLLAVWGTGRDDVYVGGIWRHVSHFDGEAWRVLNLPGSTHGGSIHGADGAVYVSGGADVLRLR